jgi:hypothetical protein
MAKDFTKLRSAIREIVEQMGASPLRDVQAVVWKELEELCDAGKLTLGPDQLSAIPSYSTARRGFWMKWG